MYFVYILRCNDGRYYVGSTQHVEARVKVHNDGRGPVFTACRRPVTLVYTESFPSIDEAVRRELQVKRWSSAKKAALISGDATRLKALAKCRTAHQSTND